MAWPAPLVALALSGIVAAAPAEDPGAGEEIARGRELFTRVWTPNDPRSRGGDGLGPVFNAASCLDCHDRGGPGGGGGADRNVEIISAAPAAGFDPSRLGGPGYAFAYGFAMDFGTGRFEYRIGSPLAGQPEARAGRSMAARLDPVALAEAHPGLLDSASVPLHRYGTDPAYRTWRAGVVGRHGSVEVRSGRLNPTPLFGLGRIDAIPEAVIEEGARRRPGRPPGRAGRTADGRIGRFGWKAQAATLAEFVAAAAATEIGLEVPGHRQAADPRVPGLGGPGLDLSADDLAALTAFVRALPAPVVRRPEDPQESDDLRAGEATFRTIGCAGCHVPDLGGVEGLYSDLLLHEMDAESADSGPYGMPLAREARPQTREGARTSPAGFREWRTPPLWGLRDSAPYLHDGRAATIDEAIRLHGGQGAPSSQRYGRLPARKRSQVVAFLESLAAPEAAPGP